MKAWIIRPRHPIEDCSVVRFADTRSKAIASGLNELREHGEADDFIDCCAQRFPEMDGRESSPPSLQELIERHGWHTQCRDCERPIDSDGANRWFYEEDDGPEFEDVVWFGDLAYCKGCVPENRRRKSSYRSASPMSEVAHGLPDLGEDR